MIQNLIYSFVGMFVAMDVVGTLPIYMGITQGMDVSRRTRILRLSMIVAAGVALSFVFIGAQIFKFIGITLYDFKMGGGAVLLVMAILDLVRPRCDEEQCVQTGVVPLAVPLITGPALITTIMLQVSLYGILVVVLALLANFSFAYFALGRSGLITRVIGREGADIASKIAALLMTAIAFSMLRSGVFEAIRHNAQ